MTYPNTKTTVTLQFPITFDGKEITEISVRRPLVRDQLIAQKSSECLADRDLKLYSLIAEVDVELLYCLDMVDFEAIQDVVMDFKEGDAGKSKKKRSRKA